MLELLWLIPVVPLASAVVLAVSGHRLSRQMVALLGAGSVGLSAILTFLVTGSFLSFPPEGHAFTQVLWTWISIGGFSPQIALYLDPLAIVMTLVVTFVGFLIHVYSTEFMIEDEGYSRFFAYMNLFVASMLVLVLGDNLLLLYLGWEGVGLCSYLLIGFWYRERENGYAARKAFIVTRVGDVAMAIGLFLLFHELGTLRIQDLMQRAMEQWPEGSGLAVAAAALLLGGAVGKSAQLPLQTWLPDAMAGPTPTSALIHAATMVTAGVYLIARTHVVFTLAPSVLSAVAVVGALTLLLAGFSALVQNDIKRVLAYSTISQIGYMFLALGVGAWTAAIFHFMTHAFFKALLFLSAGIVIEALHHEHDMFKMGGLRKQLPVAYWTFLIGGSALAGFPLITAGFYSKDLIVWEALSAEGGGPWLWLAGIAGILLTSLYTYRQIILVFFGELKTAVSKQPGPAMAAPVGVLSFFAIVAGFVETPHNLGSIRVFSEFLHPALPETVVHHGAIGEGVAMLAAVVCFAAGAGLAYLFYLRHPGWSSVTSPAAAAAHRFWFSGWAFDALYDRLFVKPIVAVARVNKRDFVDGFYNGLARLSQTTHEKLSLTETGRVRWYAGGVAAGSAVFLAIVLLS